jgi:hypothetical protein
MSALDLRFALAILGALAVLASFLALCHAG